MVNLASAVTEADAINAVRDTFRSYVPESDAWAQPNFFSVNATVVGGLAFSAINEAKNSFDARVNPQTATGIYLDAIAATPPLSLYRLQATKADGAVLVTGASGPIAAGTLFETAAGVQYVAIVATPSTPGLTRIAVRALLAGAASNSVAGQPLTSSAVTQPIASEGIFGGYDTENDDQLRARIFAERVKEPFFGSPCGFEKAIKGVRGVTRSLAYRDGGLIKIAFLMEDKYPCGVPLAADITTVNAYFADECLTPLGFCPVFAAACSKRLELAVAPATPYDPAPASAAITKWLRSNYTFGQDVRGCDLDAFLRDNFPELRKNFDPCVTYDATACCVYNCAIVTLKP